MIEHIYIINLSHYDIGYTDSPVVCRELQRRFLDMAVEAAMANYGKNPYQRFYWTIESNNVLREWREKASHQRRELFMKLVQEGWIEVGAMPFNATSLMNARQWQCVVNWLPEGLWQALKPKTIIQNDVNGLPRAGVMMLMDKGVEFLWMGINPYLGEPPLPQPGAFWWEMPDGRKIFVWNSLTYPSGYFLFESEEWRKGPIPAAADKRYRPPHQEDFFGISPQHLDKAHKICCSQIEKWHNQGYAVKEAVVSMTNMWRMDNDPPCLHLPDFVNAWNEAGLKPSISMTTPAKALEHIRNISAKDIPTFTGEWTDWWCNGAASAPRELSASRKAKRIIEAENSSFYKQSTDFHDTLNHCLRQLCLFDEHTFGSWNSVAAPDSLDTKAQFAEKASLAYQPLAISEFALGDENRRVAPKAKGIHVVNPYKAPFSGWISFTDDCLRGKYEGVVDTVIGKEISFKRFRGYSPFITVPTEEKQFTPLDTARVFPDNIEGKVVKFWVDTINPQEIRSFRLLEKVGQHRNFAGPEITTDKTNWPLAIKWEKTVLFESPLADFSSLEFNGPFPRWKYAEIMKLPTEAQRREERQRQSSIVQALPLSSSEVLDLGPTIVYEQYLAHPRLRFIRRTMEIFKNFPRLQVRVSIYRMSKPESAEIFYIKFPLNCAGWDACITNGGVPFCPGKEQIKNTCKDYFAIDGEVVYRKGLSKVVLDCYDNALVSFGGMNDGLRLSQLSDDLSTVYAIIFNNIWNTNFVGDEAGLMEFVFDIYGSDTSFGGFAPAVFPVVNV